MRGLAERKAQAATFRVIRSGYLTKSDADTWHSLTEDKKFQKDLAIMM